MFTYKRLSAHSHKWLASLAACILGGCAVSSGPDIRPPSLEAPGSAYKAINAKLAQDRLALDAEDVRLPPEARAAVVGSGQEQERELSDAQPRLYSFRARQLNIRDALGVFARANGLSLISDPDLTGVVTVDFTNVPLTRAFEVMLSSLGYAWEQKAGVIRVKSSITRAFELDYIRSSRSGAVSNGGASGGSSGGSSGGTSVDPGVVFWTEIEAQIRAQLSPRGRVIINRLTGTVLVTDSPPKVADIESFIALIKDGMHRQVDIEVRIVEVTLNEDFALGLDWTRLNLGGVSGVLSTIVGTPGAVSPVPPTFSATYSASRYNAVIQALKQQGDVRMVSQPRVRILNNQTAFVKVGTTETFYTRTNLRTTQQGVGVIDTISDQANAANIGVTLTVTPQISSDGWTMLNVAPIITSLVGTTVSPSGQSTAPVLEVKEASTLVRARSGELIVLGGLIEEQGSKTSRAVPGIGEVALPFNPFRGDYKASRRKELVIFMMPTVISSKKLGEP